MSREWKGCIYAEWREGEKVERKMSLRKTAEAAAAARARDLLKVISRFALQSVRPRSLSFSLPRSSRGARDIFLSLALPLSHYPFRDGIRKFQNL